MKVFYLNHHSYGCILQGEPHIVAMASTLDLHSGQSWSLTAMIATIFLADIPHLNYQINIRECFDTRVNIRGGHAPWHHVLHIRIFQNGNLLWLILQIRNFLRYNRDILYFYLNKVQ